MRTTSAYSRSVDGIPAKVRLMYRPLATIPPKKLPDELSKPARRLGGDVDNFNQPLQIDGNRYAGPRGNLWVQLPVGVFQPFQVGINILSRPYRNCWIKCHVGLLPRFPCRFMICDNWLI